jgi:ectoine hydroxylase-related dioxygenase (phytanoyl-CoA dioxygenase family)
MSVATSSPSAVQDRYQVSIDQYAAFRRDGFLIVRGLIPRDEIAELRQHTDDLMQGNLPEQQELAEHDGKHTERDALDRDNRQQAVATSRDLVKPPADLSPEEKAQHFLRIHMLHRKLALHEKWLLHPRVLDVLEVIIGPDVLALQTMLFLKPPGKPGQGWHQDSYYIPTHPDTLCGAWIALDRADEYNGGLWFAKGSGAEPVYPPCPEVGYGFGDKLVGDIQYIRGASEPDDSANSLTKVAGKYDHVLGIVEPGDVVFFNGHVLHRSKQNITSDRFRRAFVSHYCNARSFTQWGADVPEGNKHGEHVANPDDYPDKIEPRTRMTNGSHILARGDSHLPFAQPRFGTPCAATMPAEQRRQESEFAARMIADMNHGLMGCAITDPTIEHDHDDEKDDSGGY